MELPPDIRLDYAMYRLAAMREQDGLDPGRRGHLRGGAGDKFLRADHDRDWLSAECDRTAPRPPSKVATRTGDCKASEPVKAFGDDRTPERHLGEVAREP